MSLSKNYLQLEFSSGHFFDYSKEQKDGYVKHVSTKGNESYRKYYKDGVDGVLDSVSIYDGKFGQQISISLKKEDEIYYLPVNIYDQKGQVDNSYTESLIKLLPLLEKGQNLNINGYNFKPEDSQYSLIGFSIKVSGEKLKSSITNSYYNKDGALVEGGIPPIVWVEKLGKKRPSAASVEAKDAYLLGLLEREEKRLTWKKEDSDNAAPKEEKPVAAKTSTPTAEKASGTPPTPLSSDDDEDDLPF
jgi:hypothetical protein